MNSCEDVEQSNLKATAAKAQAFSATLARIDAELTKSLTTSESGRRAVNLDQGEGRREPLYRGGA